MTDEPHPLDVVQPARVAELVEQVGIRKARLGFVQSFALAVLAGAFIAFGAMFFTVIVTQSGLGYGPTRLLGGAGFALGLILVILGGAELFTGNALVVMAWASRDISTAALLRNWSIVYAGNLAGAVGTAVLVHLSGTLGANGGAVGETALAIAASKLALDPLQAFVRGVLCNVLVCLAVWMCFAAQSVAGKVLVILFPVSAFVALGFEHSVANMYFLPLAMMQAGFGNLHLADLTGIAVNLAVVTAGNVLGGGGLVALVYWTIYLRPPRPDGGARRKAG